MFKRIKNKALRIILSSFICLIGLMIAIYLMLYLSVPSYHFNEPRPFSGEYLYNPYQNINPDQWKKFNFHCHSQKFFGLTNGRLSKEEDIDSVYQYLGYDHYGISDYMNINRHNAENEGFIPAYEHGYGLIHKTHQLCIGAEKVWRVDYPFMQNLNIKQHTINKLNEHSHFVVPAHASFTNGYKPKEMKYLSNYRLLEIKNPYGDALAHWDVALSNGHRVYGIGDDDTHNVKDQHEVGLNMTIINTQDLEAENVYDALNKGKSYVLELNNYFCYNKPTEFKKEQIANMPYLTRAELVGDTLFVETSAKKMEEVFFIGQGGDTLTIQNNVKTAFYVIQPENTYIRTTINVDKIHLLYLNPVTRHQTKKVIDIRLDSINFAQTILYWIVYAAVLVASVWYIIRLIKQKRKTNDRT